MKKKIVVNDKMQSDYTYYLTQEQGKGFDSEFNPDLTPKQLLKMGIFGGKYMTDCKSEFPSDWFKDAKLSPNFHNSNLNFFGINASKPLSYWQAKGWIHPQDPRGWFQWYCRYFMGRRTEDDSRQIKRWKMMKRHIAQVKKNCPEGFLECRKKQRQALLHWAYDSRRF
jgi:hypothetical protein